MRVPIVPSPALEGRYGAQNRANGDWAYRRERGQNRLKTGRSGRKHAQHTAAIPDLIGTPAARRLRCEKTPRAQGLAHHSISDRTGDGAKDVGLPVKESHPSNGPISIATQAEWLYPPKICWNSSTRLRGLSEGWPGSLVTFVGGSGTPRGRSATLMP